MAKKLTEIAGEHSTLSKPAYQQAISYYQSLAGSGGRAKQQQAVQPDISRLNEQYRGAATRIARSLTGPARDQALADLVRQHAQQIGELTGAPRQAANEKLLQIGESGQAASASALGQASGAFGNAANTSGNVYGAMERRDANTNAAFQSLGADFAKLWAPYFKQMGGKKGNNPMAAFSSMNPAQLFSSTMAHR